MLNKNIERIVQDIEDSETIHDGPLTKAELDYVQGTIDSLKHPVTNPATPRPAAATGDETVTVTIPKGIAGYMFDHAEGEIAYWQAVLDSDRQPDTYDMAVEMLRDWKATRAALEPLTRK